MKARSFLESAIETLAERGGKYESDGEENSMANIVRLHCDLAPGDGMELSELEGWFFMLALKLVRLRKSIEQGKASKDSIVDLLGYTAKMGECLFADEDELTLGMISEAVKAAESVAIKPVMRDGKLVYEAGALGMLNTPLYENGPTMKEAQIERNRILHDKLTEFGRAICLHTVCTMKDIDGDLAIVCDACDKVITAREYVDGESEYEAGADR